MILTASQISTSSVTDAQIGACHLCYEGSKGFYKVENSKGKIDPETGYIKEYSVRWNGKDRGFSCDCEAGKYGFKNGLCWHIRASIAAAREEREAVAELERAIATQAAAKPVVPATYTNVDQVTMARVQAACEAPVKVSRAKANSPKGFSLLRV